MPITFQIEDYPFLGTIGPAGLVGQLAGIVTVPADGASAPAVTFATPFSSTPVVVPGPNTGGSASGEMLSVQFFNVTTTGFSVICYGGAPTTTITVGWIAYLGS